VQRTIQGEGYTVSGVAFSPDGKRLASIELGLGLLLRDIATWRVMITVGEHGYVIACLAFSPDGKSLAVGSHDRTVRLWDWASGTTKQTLKPHDSSVLSIAFSPDGKTMAATSSDWVKLWDVASGRELRKLATGGSVYSVAFSPDGTMLAVGTAGANNLQLWDASGVNLIRSFTGHTKVVRIVYFTPDGKSLVSSSDDGTVRLWDVVTGKIQAVIQGDSAPGSPMALAPDGRAIALRNSKDIRIVDIRSQQERVALEPSETALVGFVFSADSRLLASWYSDNTIRLSDTTNGQTLHTLKGLSYITRAIAFTADGKMMVSAGNDGVIHLWGVP
jgi:WD40 repeat protein